jgi:hypothetical protein
MTVSTTAPVSCTAVASAGIDAVGVDTASVGVAIILVEVETGAGLIGGLRLV